MKNKIKYPQEVKTLKVALKFIRIAVTMIKHLASKLEDDDRYGDVVDGLNSAANRISANTATIENSIDAICVNKKVPGVQLSLFDNVK